MGVYPKGEKMCKIYIHNIIHQTKMNYILGAKNKTTNRYENIYYVDKANKYQCICCDSDLMNRNIT